MRTARLLPIFSAFLVASTATQAQNASPPPTLRVIALIEEHKAEKKIPGLSVAVVIDKKLAWAQGFGLADVENKTPATENTVYRFASISKAITATAAMRLVELGKLELDKPVSEYVDRWPTKDWPITTRQLLGHLGGIRHYRGFEINSSKSYPNLELGLNIFASDPLLHQPGEKFAYTTYGYTLAGCAMEAASGQRFTPLLKELLFDPAGMTATRDDSRSAIIPERTRGYHLILGETLANCRLADTSYKIPGGGLCGTAPDLARFAIALMEGTLLTEKSHAAMWTRGKTNKGKATNYGLGWQLAENDGFKEVSHGGAQQGTSTYLYLCPERGHAVVVLCNLEKANPKSLAQKIVKIYLGG